MGQSFFLIGGEEGLGAGKRDFFSDSGRSGAWPVGPNRDGDQGEVATVSHSKSLPCPGLEEPPPYPYMLQTHTYWPMGVKGGLLEVLWGCFRNWLSRWRSLFSSHTSTEALWEALLGGSGGEGRTDSPKAVE